MPKINVCKVYQSISDGLKMPRKVKKWILGERISHCKLTRMKKNTVLGEPIQTMYERREAKPYGLFCPKCGYPGYHGSGNRTSYPEHWEYFYCNKCYNIVGIIDNSPFQHALEFPENNYKI